MTRLNSLTSLAALSVFSSSSGSEYTGATMLFAQTSAPIGWTKDTTLNDYALRVTTGSVSTGGSVSFTAMNQDTTFTGTASVTGTALGATTLSAGQLPLHYHQGTTNGSGWRSNTPSPVGTSYPWVDAASGLNVSGPAINSGPPATAWGGGSHVHTVSPGSTTAPANSPFSMSVRYHDVILATRN